MVSQLVCRPDNTHTTTLHITVGDRKQLREEGTKTGRQKVVKRRRSSPARGRQFNDSERLNGVKDALERTFSSRIR
jgi:hypothetical protein